MKVVEMSRNLSSTFNDVFHQPDYEVTRKGVYDRSRLGALISLQLWR